MNSYATEIEKKLNSLPRRTSAHNPESYIGGGQSRLNYIGLRVPQLHAIMKEGFSFSLSPPHEIAKIWDEVWKFSDCYEVMALALTWFEHPENREHLRKNWPRLKKWASKIDNWAHSDSLSGIYSRILEDHPELVYPTLVTWNRSTNPWLRRQSIVSLLYYSRSRKKVLPLKKILNLVESLLEDPHYYVQKGVGWTLRETGNVYPDETLNFLKKHILRIAPAAYGAATEKLPARQRQQLKILRKARS